MRRNQVDMKAPGTKRKFFVDVIKEEKGKPERKKFNVKELALAYAERKEARGMRVRVTDVNRKEIYSSQ